MRRLRRTDWSRRLVRESALSVDDLIWPVFVHDGEAPEIHVPSMPGVSRMSLSRLVDAAVEAQDLGIPAMAGIPRS